MKLSLSCVMCLAVLPSWASAAGAKAEIFPALRKRKEQQKVAAVQVAKHGQPAGPVLPAAPAEDTQEAATTVPAPLDAGADGYPELPAVSQMLSQASGTLKSVNTQASSLEARVVQAQMQSEAKMAKQKAAFEEKLKQQEQGSQNVISQNANISAEIKELKNGNAALRKHAREIEETNKLMRSELKTLQSRLGVAKEFTSKSLASTDDSKNSLLQVLKGGHRHKHAFVETGSKTTRANDDDEDDEKDDDDSSEKEDDKDDDKEEDDDDEEGSTSFLAIKSKVRRASSADGAAAFEEAMSDLENAVPDASVPAGPAMPDAPASSPVDLLDVLSKDVAHLAQQEKESEKTLKNLFIRDFRAGAKRHQALVVQQKGLISTRTSLQTLQTKLKSAEAHLEATRSQLEGRLHGLGQYIQKLAHFAMAPQHEVPHLLEVLPKAVTVKGEAQKEA